MSAVDDARYEYLKACYTDPLGTPVVTRAYADEYIVKLEACLAERDGELDKWQWIARDACEALAYETHVNPHSPLDYRLACWAKGSASWAGPTITS